MKEIRNIPFSPPDITEAEIQEVCEVLRSGWITTGPKTKELEKRLAEFCNTNKAICLNSATSAEELNLRILGIKEGDEVICPAYTYTATAAAAVHVGATVKFVDCKKDSFHMDYDKMEEAITEKTKAIIPVDIGGVLCDYDRIFEAVERKKHLFKAEGRVQEALGRVAVVADSAHALGAERNGKKAGEIADFTSFSFHAVKNLTTAEGGAATWRPLPGIDDEAIYRQYSLYSLHGQSKDALAKTNAGAWEYDVVGTWYKCNMTDIMAAMGLKQLERYPQMLEKRKEYTRKYDAMCQELGLKKLEHFTEDGEGSCHLYLVRVPGITFEQRNEIIEKMAERGIACNVHYKPLPMMSAYKAMGWDIKDFPESYKIFENEITLPLNTKMTEEDVDNVIENLKEIIKCY